MHIFETFNQSYITENFIESLKLLVSLSMKVPNNFSILKLNGEVWDIFKKMIGTN